MRAIQSIVVLSLLLAASGGSAQTPTAPTAQQLWDAGDYKGAVDQARALATVGDLQAQYMLGLAYAQGLGVVGDDSVAETWLTRAATDGHVEAARELGQFYLRRRAKNAAAYWLDVAAKAGDAAAASLLASPDLADARKRLAALNRAASSPAPAKKEAPAPLPAKVTLSPSPLPLPLSVSLTPPRPSLPVPTPPPPRARPTPPPAVVIASEAPSSTDLVVQVGAFRSQPKADHIRETLVRTFPVLRGHKPLVVAAGGVFRLMFRVADRPEGRRLCAELLKDKQDCIVVRQAD
jgi:hypothetical protein